MKPIDASARVSRPEFDVHLTENVMLAMRDGVRLATDIYRPARDGRPLNDRRPVLLHRTPYFKVETEAPAARGYVVVNQDCRECFHSESEVNFLIYTLELALSDFGPGSSSDKIVVPQTIRVVAAG